MGQDEPRVAQPSPPDAKPDPQGLRDVPGIAKPEIELTRSRDDAIRKEPVHDGSAAPDEHHDAEPQANCDVGRGALGREENERRMVARPCGAGAHLDVDTPAWRDDEARRPYGDGAARLEDPYASTEAEGVARCRHAHRSRLCPTICDVERLGLAGGERDARRRDRNRDRGSRDHLPMTVKVTVEV